MVTDQAIQIHHPNTICSGQYDVQAGDIGPSIESVPNTEPSIRKLAECCNMMKTGKEK
jgi:hypothetical protein